MSGEHLQDHWSSGRIQLKKVNFNETGKNADSLSSKNIRILLKSEALIEKSVQRVIVVRWTHL